MSITSFLFGGSAPPSVNTYSSTSSSIPGYINDYQQNLLSRASAIGSEPWQQYSLPNQQSFDAVTNSRVAPLNGYQNYGNVLGQQAATSYQPTLNAAISGTQGALSGTTGSAAATPYLQNGALSWPGQAQQYMNPFTNQVANRTMQLSNQNLFENVLPGINDNFVGSGTFGASRQGDFTNRAVRDQSNTLTGALGSLYSDAYNQGASIFNNDASRNIQAGNIAGSLANQDRSTTGALSQNLAGMANQQQQQGLTGAAAYQQIGDQQQQQQQRGLDVNYQNFLDQRNWPMQQGSWMNSMLSGINAPVSTQSTQTGPAQNYNAPGFAQLLGGGAQLASLFGKNGPFGRRGGRVERFEGYLTGGRVRRGVRHELKRAEKRGYL